MTGKDRLLAIAIWSKKIQEGHEIEVCLLSNHVISGPYSFIGHDLNPTTPALATFLFVGGYIVVPMEIVAWKAMMP